MAPLNKILQSSPGGGPKKTFALSSVAFALMVALLLVRRYRTRSSRLPARRSKNDIQKNASTPLTCRKAELKPSSAQSGTNVILQSQEMSRNAVQYGRGKVQTPMGVPCSRGHQMEISTEEQQVSSPSEGIVRNVSPLNNSTDVHHRHDNKENVVIPYPVPSEVVTQISSSHAEYHGCGPDANAGERKLPLEDKTIKTTRPLRTAGLQNETVQIFSDAGLDQPRRWRRRILEYS